MTQEPVVVAGMDAALHEFGVEAVSSCPLETGRMNSHWAIETELSRLVLRRYRAWRSAESIRFEHDLLRHAGGKGWPVPVALLANHGSTMVEAGGATWSLFPFLVGEPALYDSLTVKHAKGQLLARLHDALSDFPRTEQRDGSGRLWELDVFVRSAGHESFNALLSRFAAEYPELATAVRREKYRNLRELARLGYGELPPVIVHGDFHQDNLRFRGRKLTGLLDFDLAAWDAAVADLGRSLSLECLQSPAHDAIDLEMAGAFLAGYVEQRRLSIDEARVIPALVRASFLWLVMFRLTQWAETGSERAVASIARSVERRFPALLARWGDLTRVCEVIGA